MEMIMMTEQFTRMMDALGKSIEQYKWVRVKRMLLPDALKHIKELQHEMPDVNNEQLLKNYEFETFKHFQDLKFNEFEEQTFIRMFLFKEEILKRME